MFRYIISIILVFSVASIYAQPVIDNVFVEPELIEQVPTYQNIPSPENVLVVYKFQENSLDTIGIVSNLVKNYYLSQRNIPIINTLALELDTQVVIDDHVIKLFQNGEIIRDTTQAWLDRFWTAGATIHAWQYFNSYIFIPIQNYLANTFVNGVPLKNTIKYVVLCKGIPIRIQSRIDGSGIGFYSRWNVALDPLLCYLNQEDQQFSILNLFNTSYSNHPNPYRYQDPLLNFSYRFQSHQFPIDGTNLKLSYLVSRLDGLTQDKVIDLINNSKNADHSGSGTFIFDSHPFTNPSLNSYNQILESAHNILISLGFNSVYDNYSPDPIYTSTNPILGYISWGVHSGLPTGYVLDNLSFTFKPGAIVNTLESFNGSTMGLKYSDRNIRRAGQGLISEFIYAGSSSGPCHTWEPYLSMAVRVNYTYTKYAMGYNLVDAIYLGMPTLGWQNVVIGDPLQTIAWGKQSLTSDLNWSGSNLVTGEIDISDLKTLTIANNSVINLRHQGFITGEGKLILGQNVTFNLYSWDKGLFLSYDSDNPRLVWGAHPTLGSGANYKVYRKFGVNGSWVLIATTSAKEYKDLQMQFSLIGDEADNLFYKVIAFSELPGTYESNIVACTGNKAPKKIKANQNLNSPVEYSLEQNYPNPFNPTTQINYSIKEGGLVQLKIYDILGKEVATLVNENKEAGNYSVDFNATELPSGVYVYQLTTTGFTQARKMILAK